MKRPSILLRLAGLLLATGVLAGCVSLPSAPADTATLLGRTDAVLRQADPARTAVLSVMPPEVRIGQPVQMQLASTTPGYAYVFQLGSDSKSLSLVFPNAMDGANYMAAGTPLVLPRPGYALTARGPAGQGYLLAVVADKPQDLLALTKAVADQRIVIDGRYGAALAAVREVAP